MVTRGGFGWDIGLVSVQGDRRLTPLLSETAVERNGEVSPDGRWLAYDSSESGQLEVYVRPFPNVEEGRWLISRGGGTHPAWARNGQELFYLRATGGVMAVPIQRGATVTAGNPQQVFEGPYLAPVLLRGYDVSPDGQRFLMIKSAAGADSEASGATMVVVQEWFEELKRLVPTP